MDLLLKTITPALSAIQTGTKIEKYYKNHQQAGQIAGVWLILNRWKEDGVERGENLPMIVAEMARFLLSPVDKGILEFRSSFRDCRTHIQDQSECKLRASGCFDIPD
jgi:hypothetical protein